MDAEHFDRFIQTLSTEGSRRDIVRAVAGFALAGPLSALLGLAGSHTFTAKYQCVGGDLGGRAFFEFRSIIVIPLP